MEGTWMEKYEIHLINGQTIKIECEYVQETVNRIKFCNRRKDLVEQRINGPEIIGSFNSNEIRYFIKEQ